jgi:SAM-dependent methyltransferase
MKPEQLFKTYLQNDNKDLFRTFNSEQLNIDWKNVSILDYGCNQGNFLNSAAEHIAKERYLGIDIIPMAIGTAQSKNPGYRFLHYDKWHQAYNPTGNKNLKITDVLHEKFDVIISYSVFTHNTIEQAKSELEDLKKLLNPNGIILFTMWRSDVFEPFYNWIFQKFENVAPIDFATINYKQMAYWINTSIVVTDTLNFESDDNTSFNTFYDIEWLKQELAPAIHLGIPIYQYQDLFCLKN